MLNLKEDQECDTETVEALVTASTAAMSRIAERDDASPSEVLTALFTILDRTLYGIRRFQEPAERFGNAIEIRRVLDDLIIDHGRLPN
jgi:hypothetical protein